MNCVPKRAIAWLVVALVGWLPARADAQLPGLSINGETWTYAVSGKPTVAGILFKPPGEGPFPAVVISHGKGGSATGFSLPKAREIAAWGLVCIGPLYTHGTGDPDFGDVTQEGSRPENLRRASACVDILASLPYVDGNRIALYGNSMGAFVSIGLAGQLPDRFKAVAITAGGIVESGDWPAPSVAEADPIRTPFLILHGTLDTTVRPEQSALLEQVLRSHSVDCLRVLYEGEGHNIHQTQSADVMARMKSWFETHGMFTAAPVANSGGPRGIYVLDSRAGTPYKSGTLRDANLRSYPFVAGYVLRCDWEGLEPALGQYDFTMIDNLLSKLPAGQKLSLILGPQDPAYIAAHAGVTTWTDIDRDGRNVTRAVPWDPYLRERRAAFLQALAGHVVGGNPLRDHPALVAVNPYMPGGFTGVRDPNTVRLKDLPGYTREKFKTAVLDELRLLTTQFPGKFVQIGFWKVLDAQASPAAWEEIRTAILAEFNGVTRPRVGFFMENLAASRPAIGQPPVTGYPITDFGAPLYLSREQTWTAFQALTSWLAPFTGPEKVAFATPTDGMLYAYETYGTKYFELYVNDIDNAAWQADFSRWAAILEDTRNAADPSWLRGE